MNMGRTAAPHGASGDTPHLGVTLVYVPASDAPECLAHAFELIFRAAARANEQSSQEATQNQEVPKDES